MSQEGFKTTDDPYTGLAITGLVYGLGKNTAHAFPSWNAMTEQGAIPSGDTNIIWGLPINDIGSAAVYQDGDHQMYVADFGMMREVAKCIKNQRVTFENMGLNDTLVTYPYGPYAHGAAQVNSLLASQRSFIASTFAGLNPLPAMSAAPDPSAAVSILTNNTSIWGAGAPVDTLANMLGLPSTYYAALLDHAASGLTFSTATIPAITTPELMWDAPTGGAITAATITAPTAVDVADNVDAAVVAFTDLANTRLAADQAQLRATLFSTRQAMTSTFDGALAILAANAAAQIADYDKSARLDQARMQAQADMEHQRLSVQVGSQNAQLALDADKANSQFALSAKDTETRFLLGAASAVTAAQSAANEVALSIMRARSDLLRMIYDTTIAWMGAKASLLTNAGPVASVINNAYDLQYKTAFAKREQAMGWNSHLMGLVTQQASNENALAGMKYNALTQNLQLYQNAINTAGGIGGSIHRPSTFENVSAGIGLAAGLAATAVQIGLAVAG